MNIFFKHLQICTLTTLFVFACMLSNAANAQSASSDVVVVGKEVSINLNTWPETSQKVAKEMIQKYGQPAEVTPNRLIWHNTGPFKRTIVYKEEVQHEFPMPHKDVLEQFVNYMVPADKFDELASYDGSVICERTKGEMSARCDKEGANILALNLAHDIITDKRNVEEAREFYANAIMEMLKGNKPDYMHELQFKLVDANIGYTDRTVMDMSKVKELKQNKKQK